jgi:hypothetical protein
VYETGLAVLSVVSPSPLASVTVLEFPPVRGKLLEPGCSTACAPRSPRPAAIARISSVLLVAPPEVAVSAVRSGKVVVAPVPVVVLPRVSLFSMFLLCSCSAKPAPPRAAPPSAASRPR